MNGAKTDERNYYAESYIALIEAIIKERSNFRGCLNLLPLKLCKA